VVVKFNAHEERGEGQIGCSFNVVCVAVVGAIALGLHY